jgi:hypothetical protein
MLTYMDTSRDPLVAESADCEESPGLLSTPEQPLSAYWLTPAGAVPARGGRVLLLPCGVLFDAVRTPVALGMPVLNRLLAESDDAELLGPVLWDGYRDLLYWLVSPGATDDYPDEAKLLGVGAWVAAPLPFGRATKDAAWLHLPEQRIVTGPAWLSAALNDHGMFGVAA